MILVERVLLSFMASSSMRKEYSATSLVGWLTKENHGLNASERSSWSNPTTARSRGMSNPSSLMAQIPSTVMVLEGKIIASIPSSRAL